jgi:tetratricopeptide (TPR) repeat protein
MRTVSAALAVALFSSVAIAATTDELMLSGKQALRRGDAEKAAEIFEQVATSAPKHADAQYWLGSSYGTLAQKASLFKQASLAKKTKNAFERAVQLDPNHVEARFGLLDYYSIAPGIMGGDMEKAFAQAAEIRKRDALAGHRAYARLYGRQKKPDLVRKEFAAMVAEQPNSAKARYFYAGYLLNEKNYKAALDEIEAALRIDPTYMPSYYRLGQLAGVAGTNFGRGEEALKKYIAYQPAEDEPPHGRAWYWLGTIYEKEGRKADAKQSYQTALRLMPGAKDISDALKRVS